MKSQSAEGREGELKLVSALTRDAALAAAEKLEILAARRLKESARKRLGKVQSSGTEPAAPELSEQKKAEIRYIAETIYEATLALEAKKRELREKGLSDEYLLEPPKR